MHVTISLKSGSTDKYVRALYSAGMSEEQVIAIGGFVCHLLNFALTKDLRELKIAVVDEIEGETP